MRENADQNNSEYGHFLRSVLYFDRSLGMCKLGRMECVNWSETWNFYQKLYEYILEGLVSVGESFHCMAFVFNNILMLKFYFLCPHLSKHLS